MLEIALETGKITQNPLRLPNIFEKSDFYTYAACGGIFPRVDDNTDIVLALKINREVKSKVNFLFFLKMNSTPTPDLCSRIFEKSVYTYLYLLSKIYTNERNFYSSPNIIVPLEQRRSGENQ